MPRNLDKRVEIVFPLKDEKIKQQAKHILDIQLADNLKAHILQPDGSYEKIDKRGKKMLICAQDYFCEEAVKMQSSRQIQFWIMYSSRQKQASFPTEIEDNS